jgi:2-polyprenyl-6-methoxyphenol hydroxylase-like FAD-dependent oxidoreductase
MTASDSSTVADIQEVPVIIIGGSLVGLTNAMFLGLHGVKCISIEKHQGTAIHPRAGYFQLRTMELMRVAGIEDKVIKAAHALYDPNGGLNAVETLAGREIANYIPDINQGVDDVSPVRRLFMPQQVLEPIIKDRATELGSEFLYSNEVIAFKQDADGVSITAAHIDTGEKRHFRAQYLIACDGNRSPVRESLGIKMEGHPVLSHSITIYFRADCSHALRGRNLGVIYVNNPQVRGFFRLEKTGLGGFLVIFTVGDIKGLHARNAAKAIDQEKAEQMVRDAVGEQDLAVNVEDIHRWVAVCHAARRFQDGRIFLAGDAAHTMTPTGGFGGNTGVQDAHNLAWKIDQVVRGDAGSELLETYNDERQPAGRQAIEQAYQRYVTRSDPDIGTEGMMSQIPDMHVEYNRYRSAAVIQRNDYVDDNEPDIDPRKSFALPGTRAPHIELFRNSQVISSLDLYGRDFVLVAAFAGSEWIAVAAAVAKRTGIKIDAHLIADIGGTGALVDMPMHREKISSPFSNPFSHTYGIEPSGAVLVRPDGYVGWRIAAYTSDAVSELSDAITRILCR